jgi:hypothetical protein
LCLSLNHVNLCRLCPTCPFGRLLERDQRHLHEDAQLPEHLPGAWPGGREVPVGVPRPSALLLLPAPQLLSLVRGASDWGSPATGKRVTAVEW